MPAPPIHSLKVVLIEDHDATRYVLRGALEVGGFQVTEVADGWDGLRAVAAIGPDLVVTDLALPGLTGIQVARALRADDGTREVPVVLVSAHLDLLDDPPELSATFDAVLRKPVDPAELLAVVRRLIERR